MTTLTDIQKKIKELQAQEAELINKEKNDVVARMLEQIKAYGITAQELGFDTPSTTKKTKEKDTTGKVVKYRNGDLVWSGGRGMKPKWVKEIISKEGIEALEKYKV